MRYAPSVSRSPLLPLLAAMALLAGGCGGDELEKLDLSGTATFGGEPIVYGTMTFTPDRSQGHKGGPQGYTEIVNGKYDTAANGEGVVPGPHSVRVTAYPEPLPEPPPDAARDESLPPPSGPEPLFVGYTIELDLQEPKQDIVIPAEAEGFDLYAPSGGRRRVP